MSQTLSDERVPRRGADGGAAGGGVLRVLLHAAAPETPTSRHLLDGITRVELGRGDAPAVRIGDTLRLSIADPLMSTAHAALRRVDHAWVIEDLGSKNGVLLGGQPTRAAPLRAGELFELGHTLFTVDDPAPATRSGAPLDLRSDQLTAPRPELVTFDPAMAATVDALARVAPTDVPVLLLGETGTGKEVAARALHALSGRRGAFVAVNCGGISAQLLESELFGHRAGAFSGALHDRPGHLRSADRGTLFLDEIADLPLPAQAALLRALQERAVVPVGESLPIATDFRLCAATHADLPAMVAAGRFRDDLHARLLGVTLTLPPLRARRADLGLLISRLLPRPAPRLTPSAAYALLRHDWPRNIRELERTLAAARSLAGDAPIDLHHLPASFSNVPSEPEGRVEGPAPHPDDAPLIDALTRHHGNVAAVARELGKHREQIHRWLRRAGIDPDRFRDS
jgi:DNA-binding NtrC family response regulator